VNKGIERFIRPELVSMGAYSTHKAPEMMAGKTEVSMEEIIKLDANENPYGCSPQVQKALAVYNRVNIYPDAGQYFLRQQLQKYTGVDADLIVAANGSGELLDYILCLFLEQGDEVINCVPTFDMYRVRTVIQRGKLVNVNRIEDFSIDIPAVKAAVTKKTKLIVFANPNNPAGNITPEAEIIELLEAGVPVLVDEAYYEFCGETVAHLVGKYENLMVLRTFSKWAGLAGLRIGYGIFPREIAACLMKIKLPYNVSVAALEAVRTTMEDTGYLMENVKSIIKERERLFGELNKLGWLKPFPSKANFIFCRVLKGNAVELQQKLQEKGILVRYFNQPMVQNCIRISVGKPEHTDALMEVLRKMEVKADAR